MENTYLTIYLKEVTGSRPISGELDGDVEQYRYVVFEFILHLFYDFW